ncbi:Neuropilin-2 Vascular endothelial cell growth factor 165 receptor 2 Precursor [Channa argus]|uniref:Neuropilin-2 Vascular endothelial cell growth factor 165 receptor 2 n=1 Tax=Channa argus TaxID=215402 RepID=A0A6G1QUZ2_CHAAH|nr:Neuropilin-2 Vascular endothelial cell growth factor 165 receptor 2 Precursor [Channa argus]
MWASWQAQATTTLDPSILSLLPRHCTTCPCLHSPLKSHITHICQRTDSEKTELRQNRKVQGISGEEVSAAERERSVEVPWMPARLVTLPLPGYPLEYPPHQNCHWIITAPEASQRIVLNFNPHFEIERLDCKYDFIEIRDGTSDTADVLGRHCSNIAPAPIISSGPSLQIRFVSDYAHQGAGFSLRYEIFKTGSEFCFRNFTSSSGMIESPGFPDKYPHNLECSYMIIAPPRMDITLTFLTFDLENDPLLVGEGDCKYDWLDVWDGLPQVSPLIGRYCGTKIPPEIQSSSGLLSLSFHTDMAVAKDGFSARYNITHKEVTDSFHCSMALGMESGKISDDQITASTSFYDNRWLPRQARLNNDDNAWTPSEDSNKEYIQVDLHFLKVLTGIATQGAISKETQKSYYVNTFKLEVSTNGEDWMVYRHGKNHKIFHANTDPAEVVLNRVPQPVLARFVRIRPQTWKNGIALRFELYGCQITDAPCSDLQGLLSGLLPDAQISASSSRDMVWNPGTARLVASRSGWFPAPAQPLAGEEWLQVDLGVPKTVRGVITQGARGGDAGSGATTDNRAFVRKYKVAHSLNAKEWNFIMDSKTSLPKIFEGNTHYDTPELRHFEETVAQYIRLYPERWSPAGIGMRVEILACDLPEISTPADTATPTLPVDVETATVPITTTVATSPPSDSVCDFDHGLCGWTHDPNAPLYWSLHSHELNSYLYMDASLKTEQQRARLVSPVVAAETGPLCLLFSYQLWGEAQGQLKVLLRDAQNEETLLWTLKDDQGPVWKEGRTILPRSPKDFQVVMEGFFVHGTRGHIWIDNIHMSSSTPLKECTRGGVPVPPLPIHWHYIMAAGGALLLLAVAILVRALCCCRQHLATKKSQLSVAYHSSSQCFQYSNWSSSMAAPGVEPVLTVTMTVSMILPVIIMVKKPNEFGDGRLFSGRNPLGGVLQFPEWNTASPSSEPPVTRVSEKDNSWLYTLDPILVTIIVMSSLGVLLGAVCTGLLLYCPCSFGSLSSRSSTTLENYNFELYDGLKHKVKLNQQRCCTEA